jgi:hypothetical protein
MQITRIALLAAALHAADRRNHRTRRRSLRRALASTLRKVAPARALAAA